MNHSKPKLSMVGKPKLSMVGKPKLFLNGQYVCKISSLELRPMDYPQDEIKHTILTFSGKPIVFESPQLEKIYADTDGSAILHIANGTKLTVNEEGFPLSIKCGVQPFQIHKLRSEITKDSPFLWSIVDGVIRFGLRVNDKCIGYSDEMSHLSVVSKGTGTLNYSIRWKNGKEIHLTYSNGKAIYASNLPTFNRHDNGEESVSIRTFSGESLILGPPELEGIESFQDIVTFHLKGGSELTIRKDGFVSRYSLPKVSGSDHILTKLIHDSPFEWRYNFLEKCLEPFLLPRTGYPNPVRNMKAIHIVYGPGGERHYDILWDNNSRCQFTDNQSIPKKDEKDDLMATKKVLQRTVELIEAGEMVVLPLAYPKVERGILYGSLSRLIGQASRFDYLDISDGGLSSSLHAAVTKMMSLEFDMFSLNTDMYSFCSWAMKHGIVKPENLSKECEDFVKFGFTESKFLLSRNKLGLEILKNMIKNDSGLVPPDIESVLAKDMKSLGLTNYKLCDSMVLVNGYYWTLGSIMTARWLKEGAGKVPYQERCPNCGTYKKPCSSCGSLGQCGS